MGELNRGERLQIMLMQEELRAIEAKAEITLP